MIIQDRTQIEQMIHAIVNNENEHPIHLDENDIQTLRNCPTLAVVDVEAEDLGNLSITARREILEVGTEGVATVLMTISCAKSYGLTMTDMQKLDCVIHSFANGTDLLWGVNFDNAMPMNKIRVTTVFGK